MPILQQVLDLDTVAWKRDLPILSERQRLRRIAGLRRHLDNYLASALAAETPADQAYRNLLAWKGAVSLLQADENLVRVHPELTPILARLESTRARLAKVAFTLPSSQQQEALRRQLDGLREEKEDLEAELARKCFPFRQALQHNDPLPELVARAVPRDAAFVDYLVYATGID